MTLVSHASVRKLFWMSLVPHKETLRKKVFSHCALLLWIWHQSLNTLVKNKRTRCLHHQPAPLCWSEALIWISDGYCCLNRSRMSLYLVLVSTDLHFTLVSNYQKQFYFSPSRQRITIYFVQVLFSCVLCDEAISQNFSWNSDSLHINKAKTGNWSSFN